MGITDLFSDMVTSWFTQEVHAEAPAEDEEETKDEDESEEKEGEEGEEGEDEKEGEGEEAEGEDEEEEEEEPEDIMPALQEECSRSSQCVGYKHHYDECVERVTAQSEDEDYKGPKEDCVEEFFHLQHCAAQCAAPRLFKALK